MEDKENPFLSSFGANPRANLWTGSDLRNVFTNPFGLLKMVSGRICYICDAVFAKRKYTVDINCLRLQYFSSQSRLYCILKQRRNHIHLKLNQLNLVYSFLLCSCFPCWINIPFAHISGGIIFVFFVSQIPIFLPAPLSAHNFFTIYNFLTISTLSTKCKTRNLIDN